ncbi:Ail/Lom family outer membrane beta-barrel protein [Rahnella sp. AN3-3W3]|uniref:Ail/Lom family outer membrane beta-barrel protein n=1 Tax=Rahnella sp. AN3-3W3 TaxID=1610578 RepID=UPI000DD44A95|nr:Ail/Lom family outer membrane beta-barrel protein [Rahnella sp. AN3-3W3]
MKRAIFLSFTILATSLASNAIAGEHSLSLGYAQSKVENFKNMPGMNLQYRYGWDSRLSTVVSFTALQNDGDKNYDGFLGRKTDHVDAEYYSILVGPAYRVNDYVSTYAVLGMSHSKMERRFTQRFAGTGEDINYSNSDNFFAYGAGVIINIAEHFTMSGGYEGSQTKVEDQHRLISGFNIGIGYLF